MSSFTWYSRLAIWIGALILIVQAVLNEPTNVVTLIGVLAVVVGLVAFVAGLIWDHFRRPGAEAVPAETMPAETVTSESEPPLGGPSKP